MYANYHTHTKRCQHAVGEDREYIETAISSGIKELGFSDHCPWIFPDGYVSGTRMLPSQVEEYFRTMTDLKKEYAADIKILIGFEAEYIPPLMEAQDKLLKDYPVDYMILGQHFLEPEPRSPYTGFEDSNPENLRHYVDSVIEGMETGRYLYVAHPDLFNFTGDDEVFRAEYTRLCRYLKSKDIPVEINLLGVREGRHYTSERFLSIASEVGNSVLIGCDAHTPTALSQPEPIEKCRSLAEKFGLTVIERLEF